MKSLIRATTNPTVTEREKRNALLARKIGAEGIVLLENHGALPLKENKVALYGAGARHTAFGGTGSGECRPRYRVSIEEGLINAGFEIATGAWLNAYDKAYGQAFSLWRKELIKGLKKCKKVAQMDYAGEHPFLPPCGEKITKAEAKVALYVLARQAGEGADRKTEKGDYYITDGEREELKSICALYPQTVLILNTNGVMDLSFTQELSLSAIVLASQAGMEAGNSLADVLSGKLSPCGRLAQTWAERYEDYPAFSTFSYRNNNPRQEDYFEDIYAGYRYFHATNVKPRYAFGYGLSYTKFQKTCTAVTVKESRVECEISVKNCGEHAGREVVQLYISAPQGVLKKEKVSLAGFAKTKQLQPQEEQALRIVFDLTDFASYQKEGACFLLEAGEYILFLGESAEELTPCGALVLNRTVVTEQCKNVCLLKREIKFFAPATVSAPLSVPAPLRIEVKAEEIKSVKHAYEEAAPAKREEAFEKLSLFQKIKLLAGTSYLGGAYNTVFGAAGYTTSKFVKMGIFNMPMADGPQGLNVTPASLKPKQNLFHIPALPEVMRYGILGWLAGRGTPKKHSRKVYYQYATAFPTQALAAQTFDKELLLEEGRAIGEEMEEFGVTFFLAPAINIQRNPLCGRNYEYYSEDPCLTGELAAAVVRGVQERAGRYAVLKHFACNNLETERMYSSSNLSERALREIYLKAFKLAVREGGARGVMASYNKVNGTYACNSRELLTDVLRAEFGFNGVVMTDWFAAGHAESLVEKCPPAGCDLIMPGVPADVKKIKRAYKKGSITKAQIEESAYRVFLAATNKY